MDGWMGRVSVSFPCVEGGGGIQGGAACCDRGTSTLNRNLCLADAFGCQIRFSPSTQHPARSTGGPATTFLLSLFLPTTRTWERTLPAYIIAEVEVHDPVPYEEYRRLIG